MSPSKVSSICLTSTRESFSISESCPSLTSPLSYASAAKNHSRVTVVCDPADYATVLDDLGRHGDVLPATRERLAAKAFSRTAAYDTAISRWLAGRQANP